MKVFIEYPFENYSSKNLCYFLKSILDKRGQELSKPIFPHLKQASKLLKKYTGQEIADAILDAANICEYPFSFGLIKKVIEYEK